MTPLKKGQVEKLVGTVLHLEPKTVQVFVNSRDTSPEMGVLQ